MPKTILPSTAARMTEADVPYGAPGGDGIEVLVEAGKFSSRTRLNQKSVDDILSERYEFRPK